MKCLHCIQFQSTASQRETFFWRAFQKLILLSPALLLVQQLLYRLCPRAQIKTSGPFAWDLGRSAREQAASFTVTLLEFIDNWVSNPSVNCSNSRLHFIQNFYDKIVCYLILDTLYSLILYREGFFFSCCCSTPSNHTTCESSSAHSLLWCLFLFTEKDFCGSEMALSVTFLWQ